MISSKQIFFEAYARTDKRCSLFTTIGLASILVAGNAQSSLLPVQYSTEQTINLATITEAAGQLTRKGYASQALRTESTAKPKISEEQASEIALKKIPGEVTGIGIEKKRGKNVYVVEIMAKKNGKETDVLVDMNSGKVLGTE